MAKKKKKASSSAPAPAWSPPPTTTVVHEESGAELTVCALHLREWCHICTYDFSDINEMAIDEALEAQATKRAEDVEKLISAASYYPNRGALIRVKVEGVKTYVTQDWGAASHEMRHFIDRDFLLSLPGVGQSLLDGCVSPVPPCERLDGTFTPGGDRVVGMLPRPLHAKWVGPDDGILDLLLDHVLVVDSMPVPLHVSIKALEGALGTDTASGSRGSERLVNALLSACFSPFPRSGPSFSVRFDKSAFPKRYHSHAFWANQDVLVCGVSNLMGDANSALQASSGNDQVTVRRCGACGSTQRGLKACGRCRNAFYCSPECQRSDWRRHKVTCNKE